MSDLVERLRKIPRGHTTWYDTMNDAADRIEELEARLRYIGDPKNGMADLPAVAREVLRGEG